MFQGTYSRFTCKVIVLLICYDCTFDSYDDKHFVCDYISTQAPSPVLSATLLRKFQLISLVPKPTVALHITGSHLQFDLYNNRSLSPHDCTRENLLLLHVSLEPSFLVVMAKDSARIFRVITAIADYGMTLKVGT